MPTNPDTCTDSRIACAGEALIDLVEDRDGRLLPCLGGAVFNISRALSRQQVPTCYLNPLSADEFGRRLKAQLDIDQVRVHRSEAVAQPSSLALVNLDKSGKPEYSFYRDGVADRAITAASLISACAQLPRLELVYTGCLALSPHDSDKYLPWLQHCQNSGKRIAIDANLRPGVINDMTAYRASVLAALRLATVIKVSDEDLAHLFADPSLQLQPGAAAGRLQTTLERAESLFRLGSAESIALTLGSEGAILLQRDGGRWAGRDAGTPDIADTVGAGDCFFAGLLSGMLRAEGPEQALQRAIGSASHCIQRRGCDPASASQIEERLARGTIQIQALPPGKVA